MGLHQLAAYSQPELVQSGMRGFIAQFSNEKRFYVMAIT